MTQAARQSQLRPERPAVGAPVDQLRRVVLARRSHHLEAEAHERLLLPLRVLAQGHGRGPLEVHGESEDRVEQAGAVGRRLRAGERAVEVHHPVRQRGDDAGRATKDAQGVVEGQGRDVALAGASGDGSGAFEQDVAVVPGIAQGDRVPVHGSDDVGSGSEVLGAKRGQRPRQRSRSTKSPSEEVASRSRFRLAQVMIRSRPDAPRPSFAYLTFMGRRQAMHQTAKAR